MKPTISLSLACMANSHSHTLNGCRPIPLLVGKKYCRRCEYYFLTERLFCECCGMRLRASPANREFKEKVRAKKKLIVVDTNPTYAKVTSLVE